jgi:tricorn protease interacting factor F2/3
VQRTARVVIPEYRLRLDVDFDGGTWKGSVDFEVSGAGDPLELDAEDLEISSVARNGTIVPVQLDPARHRLSIPLEPPGESTVRVEFSGHVDPQRMVGLYRCGEANARVLTTQCALVSARRVFPCIDRPDTKARIRLSVRAPSELDVVSNGLPERVTVEGNQREWDFAATPPMATYLFYLGLGTFDRVEDRTGRVPVGVLAPRGRGASGRFAAAVGSRILQAYEEYYAIPYPMAKLDLVAVAEQAYGAMENWGAICFRDLRLLIDESSSSSARPDVTETVCHEIAHQWFGNLVTMSWWDELWLNESFATFLEATITERIAPECESLTDFLIRPYGMRGALEADSLSATHPVRARVSTPEEIEQTTDEITYGKGSSVLRMISAYLGEPTFRAGVTDYLNRFRFRNARTEDLWESLGRSSSSDVAAVVGPWIDRPGVPVIRAELDGSNLHLIQRRFGFREPLAEPPWPIPLTFDIDGRTERILFDSRERTIPIPSDATVHLNPGGIGYYRVHYSRELFDRLCASLPRRPAPDRWIVLNDLAAFVVAGITEWAAYERAVRAFGGVTDRLIVEELTDSLTPLARVVPGDSAPARLTRSYLADASGLIGVDRGRSDPEPLRVTREHVLLARAQLDDGFAAALSGRFGDWAHLDPDLRRAVAVAYARTGGESAHREIRRALERATTEGETLRLERALAWSGEPALVASTLDLVTSGKVNRGHIFLVVGDAAENPVGRPLVEPWLESHLPDLARTFRGSGVLSHLLERTLPYAGLGRSDATRAFLRDHPMPDATRGIAKGLERLDLFERLAARLGP